MASNASSLWLVISYCFLHYFFILFCNETPPTHNNRSRAGCGVWRVAAVGSCTRTKDSHKALKRSIHIAAGAGDIKTVKQHLAAGTDVNAKDDDDETPLHGAALSDHKEIVELLIANDADVNANDEDGETPLDWAILLEHTETADLLRKHGGKTGAELKAEWK
jgi:ankyrin repeat protein